MARYRTILEAELPQVAKAIEAAGGRRYNPLLAIPDLVRGPERPEDHDVEVLTGRRPLVESAFAAVAATHPGLTIRRGVAVAGLRRGRATRAGVAHVRGVLTEEGEEISAELVVDMMGRRSRCRAGWPTPACPHLMKKQSSKACCTTPGTTTHRTGPSPLPSAPCSSPSGRSPASPCRPTTAPGAWSSSPLRTTGPCSGCATPATGSARCDRCPGWRTGSTGEPLDDRVVTLARIEDRIRHYHLDGEPIATGVVSVGDAWACTGPHRGRGATIGMLHGLALRDRLHDVGLGDPYAFARSFHHTTTKDIEPLFTSVRAEDRHRLAQIDAGIRGEEYRPADRWWELDQALNSAAACDPDCLRVFVRAALMIEPLAHALTSDGVADRIRELGANWRDEPVPAPGRDQLVALAND